MTAARTPLHQTMYLDLRARIDSGRLRVGEQLPTELELAERFGVSRGTARHALSRLVDDGAVERTPGRGTFVAEHRLTYTARELLGFSEQIRASGQTPSSRVVAVDVTPEGSYPAPDASDRRIAIERIRCADDEPIALERLVLPWPRFSGLRDLDLGALSIYDTLEERFEVVLHSGEFFLDIAALDPREAELLGEQPGATAHLMRGTVVDSSGATIVEVHSLYRPRHCTFRFAIPRGGPGAGSAGPPRLVLTAPPNPFDDQDEDHAERPRGQHAG